MRVPFARPEYRGAREVFQDVAFVEESSGALGFERAAQGYGQRVEWCVAAVSTRQPHDVPVDVVYLRRLAAEQVLIQRKDDRLAVINPLGTEGHRGPHERH